MEIKKRPRGTKVFTAENYRSTLDTLQKEKFDLTSQIEQMSVTLFTGRAQRQAKTIVKKMNEVDKALSGIERQKVFIYE
jgi:hypothetical protein